MDWPAGAHRKWPSGEDRAKPRLSPSQKLGAKAAGAHASHASGFSLPGAWGAGVGINNRCRGVGMAVACWGI